MVTTVNFPTPRGGLRGAPVPMAAPMAFSLLLVVLYGNDCEFTDPSCHAPWPFYAYGCAYGFSLLLVVVYGKCAFPGGARGGSVKYFNWDIEKKKYQTMMKEIVN